MRVSALHSWFIGGGILLVAYAAWFAAIQMQVYSQALVLILWVSPFVAAFVSAYLAPGSNIIIGVSMAIPSAVLAVILNAAHQSFGHAVDFPGLHGGLILFVSVLAYSGILCGIGAVGGRFFAKQFRKRGI